MIPENTTIPQQYIHVQHARSSGIPTPGYRRNIDPVKRIERKKSWWRWRIQRTSAKLNVCSRTFVKGVGLLKIRNPEWCNSNRFAVVDEGMRPWFPNDGFVVIFIEHEEGVTLFWLCFVGHDEGGNQAEILVGLEETLDLATTVSLYTKGWLGLRRFGNTVIFWACQRRNCWLPSATDTQVIHTKLYTQLKPLWISVIQSDDGHPRYVRPVRKRSTSTQ